MAQHKDFTARIKAVGESDGLAEGEFEAIVSVFGNKDSVGDVVVPGAFAEDIKAWEESGDPIPVIWSHDWSDPFSHIGHVTKANEVPEGLKIRGVLDLENPKAVQVHKLLKGRRVKQFSFAYDVLDGGASTKDGEDVYELRKMHVYEVGPTLVGANQSTDLLAVKALSRLTEGLKAGRPISRKNIERLEQAYTVLGEVLTAATAEDTTDEKDSAASVAEKTDGTSQVETPPAADDEPPGVKSAAQDAGYAPRRALAVARITTL